MAPAPTVKELLTMIALVAATIFMVMCVTMVLVNGQDVIEENSEASNIGPVDGVDDGLLGREYVGKETPISETVQRKILRIEEESEDTGS